MNNFLKRTVTAIMFGAVMVFGLLNGTSAFILLLVLTVGTAIEFQHILNADGGLVSVKLLWPALLSLLAFLFVCSLSLLWNPSFCNGTGLPLVLSASILAIAIPLFMLLELFRRKEAPVLNMAVGMMPMMYIALPFALIYLMGCRFGTSTDSAYCGILPLALFIFIWCNDVGAYCVGCTLGRHRLFERVSPKKSWEGSVGGAVLTVIVAAVCAVTMPDILGFLPVWVWMVTAIITVVAGTFGDLTESLIKRHLGIKDSGNILPGHGGLLDRFDSTLMAAPAVAAFLLLYSIF